MNLGKNCVPHIIGFAELFGTLNGYWTYNPDIPIECLTCYSGNIGKFSFDEKESAKCSTRIKDQVINLPLRFPC